MVKVGDREAHDAWDDEQPDDRDDGEKHEERAVGGEEATQGEHRTQVGNEAGGEDQLADVVAV